MFERPITFVVGAGASCELSLPSGDELVDEVLAYIQPTNQNAFGFKNKDIIDDLRGLMAQQKAGYAEICRPKMLAAMEIMKGLPWARSIDNYLYTKSDDPQIVELGKAAIANQIMNAEFNSYLMRASQYSAPNRHERKPDLSIPDLKETWYVPFAKLLLAQTNLYNVKESLKNVRFIIFNYDRCLEQFIWMVLQAHFNISAEQASEILSDVTFVHPYGKLGNLPWQSNDDVLPFGGGTEKPNSFFVAPRLLTFNESVQSSIGELVSKSVEWADTLVFLGFGFLKQNIELLKTDFGRANLLIATAYGIRAPDHAIMRNTLKSFRGDDCSIDPNIEFGKCKELFENYNLTLSLL